MIDILYSYWLIVFAVADLLLKLLTSAHVILHKRETRASIIWVALIWSAPLLGSLLYVTFGINRIQRKAIRLRRRRRSPETIFAPSQSTPQQVADALEPVHDRQDTLRKLVGQLTGQRLSHGNQIDPLVGGEQAYPAMLAEIENAKQSIALCTYIFDNDRSGKEFLDALTRAVARGVQVRVLIDSIGARYSRPPITKLLKQRNIPYARFLPTFVPMHMAYANLRNHRKILVVDGRIAFTGGMNIREGCDARIASRSPLIDLHFRLAGPVVGDLQDVFVTDWAFSTQEILDDECWLPDRTPVGKSVARGITQGPDSDIDNLQLTLLSAISSARNSILVVTPYFIPDAALITAFNVAALEGVRVDILLPSKNNLRMVHWASRGLWGQLLERGCRIWLSPPPFDHSKLMIVDNAWMMFGSSNWDPRSLWLNFEFNVECYDVRLAGQMGDWVKSRIEQSRQVSLEEMLGQRKIVQLRDGVARLFSPLL